MTFPLVKLLAFSALSTGLLIGSANAGAIISNGTVELGVDNLGQLNIPGPISAFGTSYVGLRYVPTNYESTAAGCLCEGWGVANAATGLTGYANNAIGTFNLSLVSFTSTASTATSITSLTNGSESLLITHDFVPSSQTPNLYELIVNIENTGTADVADLRYRRVMDWDVEPTPFNEVVTIQGSSTTSALLFSSDDGFASSNPLSGPSAISFTGDAIDNGPTDHGALFDFGFGTLAFGTSKTFSVFYGAAETESSALAALGAVGAELYSFGQTTTGGSTGEPNTFIFAFKGVGGGTIVPPPSDVPEPASLMLLGCGLMGLGAMSRRRIR